MSRHDLAGRDWNAIRHLLPGNSLDSPCDPEPISGRVINESCGCLPLGVLGEICRMNLGGGRRFTIGSDDGSTKMSRIAFTVAYSNPSIHLVISIGRCGVWMAA
jgi:hypothetical protein